MSIEIMASGSLVIDPVERLDSIQPYIGFTMVVDVNNGEGKEPVWIDAQVSGLLTQRAIKLKKGDGVWIRGHCTIRRYTHKTHERQAWLMHVNELITARETHTRTR